MRYISTSFFVALLLAMSACNKPNPEPESLDPIYKDLVATSAKLKSQLEEAEKSSKMLKADLEGSESRSVEQKIIKKDYSVSIQNIQRLRTELTYYEIRAHRRMLVDRISYKVAFEAGQVWPDPKEYSGYLVNKRLKEAPRQWSERVPRLNDRIPSSKKPSATEKPKEAAEGH